MAMAAGVTAHAQARVTFRCGYPGKYKVFFPGYPDHYCYDKVLYTRGTMPPEVWAYFAERERRNDEIRAADAKHQAEFRARWEARRAAERAQVNGSAQRQPVQSAADVAPEPARAPQPLREVSLDLVKEIAVGTSREDVIAKLGPPHSSITGDDESFRYGI
jgi:hypothetical protein